MADLITLDEVKEHCRIDGDLDDVTLKLYLSAALEVSQTHIGKRFDTGLEFTPAIKVGCLMYISFLYENREMVADVDKSEVPLTISALWSTYRDPGVY